MSSLNLKKPRVIIESPFAADTNGNRIYLHRCIRDSVGRGEAPLASHGFYPQFLDDSNPNERRLGIECGLCWALLADRQVFYTDLGWSPGMLLALHDFVLVYQQPFQIRGLDRPPQLPATLDEDIEALLRHHMET